MEKKKPWWKFLGFLTPACIERNKEGEPGGEIEPEVKDEEEE